MDCVLAGLRVGGIAVRGLSGLRRVLQVVGLRACRRDCRSCRIVWLAGLRVGGIADAYCTSRDCRIAGSGLSGLPTGGIAWQVGLPHAGLPVMGLLLAGFPCRIACVGLRVCRRL